MINLNRFLDKFSNHTEVNKRFMKVPGIELYPCIPCYLTAIGSSEIRYRVYNDDPKLDILNLDGYDIYVSLPEMCLCYRDMIIVDENAKAINLHEYYEIEPLNNPSDFINLKEDDLVIVTRKGDNAIVSRGRHFKCGVNSVELSWGDEQNLELCTFHSDIYDFYKLIKIK